MSGLSFPDSLRDFSLSGTSFPIGKDVSRIAFSKRLRVKRAVSERRPVVVGKRRPDGVLAEKARLFEPGADSRRVPVERS